MMPQKKIAVLLTKKWMQHVDIQDEKNQKKLQ